MKKIFYLLIIGLITTSFSGCIFGGSSSQTSKLPEQTLTVWRLFDDKEIFDPIIKKYQNERKNQINVKINYIKKDSVEYIEETTNALAAKKGPDIWMIRNDWMPRQVDKLVAMPEKLMTVDQYKTAYPDVAVKDNVIDNKIYGIPLSIDTLILYYNKEVFSAKRKELIKNGTLTDNSQALTRAPNNWEEFIEWTKLLTIKDGQNINFSGAALGLASNVDRSEDILSALMLQNHTNMVSENKQDATFNLPIIKQSGESFNPGTNALDFYSSFANPAKENYSWNSSFPNSLDAFVQGKTAMIIDYAYVASDLYAKSPTFSYETAPLPQIKDSAQAVDYASYWVETVTNNAKSPELAWDFVNYLAQNGEPQYLSASKRPSPVRPKTEKVPLTVEERIEKHGVDALQFQLASAQDWYKGGYVQKVDDIFRQMINRAATGEALQNTVDWASQNVTVLLRKKGYD